MCMKRDILYTYKRISYHRFSLDYIFYEMARDELNCLKLHMLFSQGINSKAMRK